MTTLLERPFLVGLLGCITIVVLGYSWLQSGRRPLAWAAVAVLLLTILAVTLGLVVETDYESVERTLHAAALAVQQDDLAAVQSFVHPQAAEIRARVAAEFPRYEFDDVSVKSNLKVRFNTPQRPTEATATFNVVVVASEREGLLKNVHAPRFCTLKFRKDGTAWKVVDYEHSDPRDGLLRGGQPIP